MYVGCPKSKFAIFPLPTYPSKCYENWGKYSVWDCGNTEFLVGRSSWMNESSKMNMELPIACVPSYVPCAVIQFLTAKNSSLVEIHRQLAKVYGSDIMSIRMARKWAREFCEGRCEVHDESRTGHPKVVTDESINTIHTLLNEDRLLT